MPDHLAALQQMPISDFAFGLQSAALEWREPCDAIETRCDALPNFPECRSLARRAGVAAESAAGGGDGLTQSFVVLIRLPRGRRTSSVRRNRSS